MNKKVLLSIEELRFIWSLGFTSGRVSESVSPKKGYAWEDETPIWNEDVERIGFANKPLVKRIKSAQQSVYPTRENVAQKVSSKSKKVAKPARG